MSLLPSCNALLLICYWESYETVCKELNLPAFAVLSRAEVINTQSWLWDMCKQLPSDELDRLKLLSSSPFNALSQIALSSSDDSGTYHAARIALLHEVNKPGVMEGPMPRRTLYREEASKVNTRTIVQQASSSHSSPPQAMVASPEAPGSSASQLGTCKRGCLEP